MAQGKLKKKVQLPKGAKQKGSHQKKQLGPKKGREYLVMILTFILDREMFGMQRKNHLKKSRVGDNVNRIVDSECE